MSKQVSKIDSISTKNPYDSIYENYEKGTLDATQKTALKLFVDKPFHIEYKPIYLASSGLKYVSNAISLITLFYAVYIAINPTIGKYAAICSGSLTCLIFEYLKNYIWRITGKQVRKYKTFNKSLFSVLLTLHIISLIGSAYGAYNIPKTFAPEAGAEANVYNLDSIHTQFEKQVATLDAQILKLADNTRSYAAKASATLANEKALLKSNYDGLMATYRAKNDSITQSHTQAEKSRYKARQAEVAIMQGSAIIAAIVFEFMFILCAIFSVYYLFRTYVDSIHNSPQEDTTPEAHTSEPITTTDAITDAVKEQPHVAPGAEEKRTVIKGFDNGKPVVKKQVQPLAYTRVCALDSCGKKFIHKVHNQKYCSESCRIESWQNKTGKKLIKNRNNK